MHNKDEKLKLKKKVYVTDEVYEILRKQKTIAKTSMAKLVCNLILEKYEHR